MAKVSDFYEMDKQRNVTGPYSVDEMIKMIPANSFGFSKLIQQTHIKDCVISTVFLGLDHSYSYFEKEGPVLFETMIFCKDDMRDDVYQVRYETVAEALKGHGTAMKWLRNEIRIERKMKKRMRRG